MNTSMYYRSPFFSSRYPYPVAPLRIAPGPRPPQPPVMCEPPWQFSGDKCVLPTRGHGGRRGNPAPNQIQPGVQGPTGWIVKNGRYVPPNAPPADTLGNVWIWTQSQGAWGWTETNLGQLLNSNPSVAAEWNKTCAQAPNGRRVIAFISVYGSMTLRVYCIYAGDSMPIPLVSKPQRSARALQAPVGPGWIHVPIPKPPKECPPGFYLWGDKCVPRVPNPQFARARQAPVGPGWVHAGPSVPKVCPPGFKLVGDKCIPIVPNPLKDPFVCKPGYLRDANGICRPLVLHPPGKTRSIASNPTYPGSSDFCPKGWVFKSGQGCQPTESGYPPHPLMDKNDAWALVPKYGYGGWGPKSGFEAEYTHSEWVPWSSWKKDFAYANKNILGPRPKTDTGWTSVIAYADKGGWRWNKIRAKYANFGTHPLPPPVPPSKPKRAKYYPPMPEPVP